MALDSADVNQAELARRTGISTKHINQIIKGSARLSVEVAVQIEEAVPAIHAKGLLLAQLRNELAAEKEKRRRAAINLAPLDVFDDPEENLFEYAPGQE